VAAVIQGDADRGLLYALRLKGALPTVVSVVPETSIVGQRVRVRAMGHPQAATGRNVIAVLRPPAGAAQYVVLLAHADGWYQAAADNGGGTAAVLRAAQQLATQQPGIGVIVGLMDGEEVGLLGSKAFVDALSSVNGIAVGDGGAPLKLADVKAVVNLDASSARASDAQALPRGIVGGDAPVFSWRAIVSSDGSALGALFATRAAQHGVFGLPVGARAWLAAIGSWRTDAGWFDDAGVPVVWPVAGYPEYHTDGDTFATVDPVDLENVALAAADTVSDAASLPSAAR
jgi:Zn-dependent M28 family amino/carboxypeptidase